MRSLLLAFAFVLTPALAHAQTLTVRDILELTKAGLDEEVLLALIEVHRPVFPVDASTLKSLKDGSVPQAVIVAIVKSGRTAPAPLQEVAVETSPPTPAPQVVVIEREREYESPRVREIAVPVPVYVPVPMRRYERHRPEPTPAEPVYWGWGGKLRPDAWKPTAADVQKDARVPREPQKK